MVEFTNYSILRDGKKIAFVAEESDARLFAEARRMYDLLNKAFHALPNDHPLKYDIDACLCHVEGAPIPGEED